MTDYLELVKRLRGPIKHPQQLINASHEAADVIEALQKHVQERQEHILKLLHTLSQTDKIFELELNKLEADLKALSENK